MKRIRTKPRKSPKKNKVGTPTLYVKNLHPQVAYNVCRRYGATDKHLCSIFEISEQTLNQWKRKHIEFYMAIRAGKDAFDCEKVEKTLLDCALGYEYFTEEVKRIGKSQAGHMMYKKFKVRNFVPPNFNAIKFWLTNRDRERWPNANEAGEGKGMTKPGDTLSITNNVMMDMNWNKLGRSDLESLLVAFTKAGANTVLGELSERVGTSWDGMALENFPDTSQEH